MRILFFGSPRIAVPFLEVCAGKHEVLAAVTNPDKPAGRGLALAPTPVKAAAERLGIPVLDPKSPSEVAPKLKAMGADMAVVVAYGRILKPDVLGAARLGFMNAHFSLLPKYRGAAPIAWSLIKGETKTGVTLFWLDEGMDTGPIQLQRELEVGPDMDASELTERLVGVGTQALEEALAEIEAGRVLRRPQTGASSTAPKLKSEDGRVDFNMPAMELHNRVRGLVGSGRAFTILQQPGRSSMRLLLLKSRLPSGPDKNPLPPLSPASVVRVERMEGILIQCSFGRIWVVEVQPEGKKPMPAAEYAHGLRLKSGDRILTV